MKAFGVVTHVIESVLELVKKHLSIMRSHNQTASVLSTILLAPNVTPENCYLFLAFGRYGQHSHWAKVLLMIGHVPTQG